MLVFWPQRLVLLATPKTGTTSLEAALESMADLAVLRPRALKHTSFASYRHHLAPWFDAAAGGPMQTIAVVREPHDWLASWYRALRREADELAEDTDTALPAHLVSFETFAEAYLDDASSVAADIGTQSAHLRSDDGTLPDRLFRYDRFDGLTGFLERTLDCELVLPRLNASPPRDTTLPPGLAARLDAALASDIALFDNLT